MLKSLSHTNLTRSNKCYGEMRRGKMEEITNISKI
jgi:hypothetical protein